MRNAMLHVIGAICLIAVNAQAAYIIDDLNTASNLSGWSFPTSYPPSTATANNEVGDKTVTMTRHAFYDPDADLYPDAGVDWIPGGSKVSLTVDHSTVLIHPVARDNGSYILNVLYFDVSDGFLSEQTLTGPSTALVSQAFDLNTTTSVPVNATSYFLRFRIEPPPAYGDTTPVSVTFTQIAAVPEPTGLGVLSFAGLVLSRRRRG